LYDKRIGFLVSYQTLIPHGGIGQFAYAFVKMMSTHNIKVDIITDKQPANSEFIKEIEEAGANIICPFESLPYTTHSNIFMYGDSYCYERMANFRNAIIQALEHNLYDILICNTYETVQVASTMGLDDCIQVIAYTHLESQIFKDTNNPFLDSVNDMMRKQLDMSNITVGTQSKFNQLQIEDSYELPIPFTEEDLLTEYNTPREGVLFIGRWEEGKNPELYLDMIEQTKLPARVMTNATGAKKFEARLKQIGVDYKIAVSVIGKEKIDFITSCRVAFNPSKVESFGIAFTEQVIHMPVVVLEKQRWLENFDSRYYYPINKTTMAFMVKALYERYQDASYWYSEGALKAASAKNQKCFQKWNQCFSSFEPRKSNSSTAKICSQNTVKYAEFIKDLNRSLICIDDVRSVLTNKHKFRTIYTDTDTYLTKDPTFEPTDEVTVTGTSLFEGL
jgi:glycosyltransferase involved in cell wall biosynthesis